MITSSSMFQHELVKLITARIEDKTQNLATGVAIQSIEQYREQVGRIAELKEVLELIEEASDKVMKTI
jgi:hypothetical protein